MGTKDKDSVITPLYTTTTIPKSKPLSSYNTKLQELKNKQTSVKDQFRRMKERRVSDKVSEIINKSKYSRKSNVTDKDSDSIDKDDKVNEILREAESSIGSVKDVRHQYLEEWLKGVHEGKKEGVGGSRW